MIYQLLLVAVCAMFAVQGNQISDLEGEELEAVRQRLYERSMLLPEEDRQCLPEGAKCNQIFGPNCCGFTFHCKSKDHEEESYPGGPKIWVPACRQWTG